MTRDEILNMPAGREMDKLIAEKIFGWSDFGSFEDGGISGKDKDGDGWILPYYSIGIAAAWEVVEKFMPYKSPSLYVVGTMWFCFFALKTGEGLFASTNVLEAKAPTAPLAICRAALLAMIE